MTDRDAERAFLVGEVEALEPFDFVAASPAGRPLDIVEVTRREDQHLEVRVPGRPSILPALPTHICQALHEAGFRSEDPGDQTKAWVREAADSASAVDLVRKLLAGTFVESEEFALDVAHGSHRLEHETRQKLRAVDERIEKVLTAMMEGTPKRDADGDFVLPVNDVQVTIAPRVAPGGVVVVRIFAVTNVGVNVAPDLGLFLARLNFSLMFGRFALDVEHRSVWVDETLLGDQFSDDELKFTIGLVASIADEWDDRLKQMFGGETYQNVLETRIEPQSLPAKPGHGGYL